MYKIAVLKGDGIGPEIVDSTIQVLKALEEKINISMFEYINLPVGLGAYEKSRSTFPEETKEVMSQCDGAILGPVSTHIYDPVRNMENPSAVVRTKFGLYANLRPIRSIPSSKFQGVDLVIVREATEGIYGDRNLYSGPGEIMPDKDTVLSFRRVTRKSSERIAKIAFKIANERKRHVSIIHKANVLRYGCGLFLEENLKVSRSYENVQVDDYHIDAFAMYLVQHPEQFDVIVTTNMFGDILSDEAAGLIGGLGFAPGLNVGSDFVVAQAAHGSAPSIAGKNVANPIAEILSSQLMLSWMGRKYQDKLLDDMSNLLKVSVWKAIEEENIQPIDLGGNSSTDQICSEIINQIKQHGSYSRGVK